MPAPLEAGSSALTTGDWEVARASFRRALAIEETAEALLGLGNAQSWLGGWARPSTLGSGPTPPSGGAPTWCRAVSVAFQLSLCHSANFGNRAVSAGWAARASRLSETVGLPV